MPTFQMIGLRLLLFSVLSLLDVLVLIGGYSLLRGLRISVHWVTWIAGSGLIVASAGLCLSIWFPQQFSAMRGSGNLLGLVSFLIALYSASLWLTRQGYRQIKQHTSAFLVRGTRDLLRFLRRHHVFLGWVVVATTLGHLVYYLPSLAQLQQYAVITGFIALGDLVLVVVLGLGIWLQITVRKQQMPQMIHTVHTILAAAFFVTVMVHMMLAR